MTPSKRPDEVVLRLPQWLRQFAIDRQVRFDTREARMQFVIDLARRNIEHKTGGPFGAAVFEAGSGRLLAPGVNLVEDRKSVV